MLTVMSMDLGLYSQTVKSYQDKIASDKNMHDNYIVSYMECLGGYWLNLIK